MFDPHDLSKALARKADPSLASRRMRHVQPLRGLRGTPHGVVAELAARTWREAPPGVEDSEALHELFCTAHEDGLLALALLVDSCGAPGPGPALLDVECPGEPVPTLLEVTCGRLALDDVTLHATCDP